ncbi:MAG: choline-sulfatase [Rhodobacteraceae bacterium]|nr:choline-sulfatase [Paracoccaceae bacterium]
MRRPNIVVIMADQLAPQFTSVYGHPLARTPHMQALAARGMRFDAAYCNSPLCAPSRFAFMSGQHISRIAAYDNGSEFTATIPTFAHYLKLLGYRTCLSGKMHFIGPDQKHGFEHRVTTDIYPADFAWTPDWEAPDERIDKWYHNMQTIKESGVAQTTYQIDYDEETGFAARRWLFDLARDRQGGDRKDHAPFALVVSFIHPHDPYVARPEWWNLYQDADIPMPQFRPALKDMDPFSRRLMDGIEASTIALSEAEIRRARRGYLANVSYFDSKVGLIVQTLAEIGELDNSIVIITADHGDMLGERGLWYKMNFFEHSARVPLIMAGPTIAQGAVSNACSLVDLLPTFIEIGGGDRAILGQPVDGHSLMPLARGEPETRDEAIGEYCAEMTPAPVFMIRRNALKYIHCDVDPPQLYDVRADPLEKRNLAGDPLWAETLQRFEAEVTARWDSAKLRADVIATQRARRALHAAMEAGAGAPWDYNPPSDASQQYVRNHMDWTVAAARYRFPQDPTGGGSDQ